MPSRADRARRLRAAGILQLPALMRFLVLATDYDGTLATHGRVTKTTQRSLEKLRASGRKLLLVTGRLVEDLIKVFPAHDVFDLIVAENGGLLYWPEGKKHKLLGPKANRELVSELRKRRVRPLDVGQTIIATREPHERETLELIHELGLELQIIFNKGAVMILPSGVNKGSGLRAGLRELGLSPLNCVAVGDAENDHALLLTAGCGAAVGNALASLKKRADVVTRGNEGQGVEELARQLLSDDLAPVIARKDRQGVLIGRDPEGKSVTLRPLASCLLVAGPSGGGKTSITTSLLEHVAAKGFQFCVIDPEGDYEKFPGTIRVGGPAHPPEPDEVIQLLECFENPVVNLLGLPLNDRPGFFASLLNRIQELRRETGRPHWLVIDEAHHMLARQAGGVPLTLPTDLSGTLLVTVCPERISPEALRKVNLVLAVGENPGQTLRSFARAARHTAPEVPRLKHRRKLDVIAWVPSAGSEPLQIRIEPGKVEHDRHERKYARGDLEESAFVFRGPKGKLRLRAQNLQLFNQIAAGIDDETWEHHLRRHDYSTWIRRALEDDELADAIKKVEKDKDLSPRESRKAIADTIERAYAAAA